MQTKTIIDVSGYGHSGKTAVTDYLKQFKPVIGFPNHVEFELFRVPGGLIDLYYSIYESWSLIRSRIRIEEFRELVTRIGTVQNLKKPITYFRASGHGYNQYFKNKFIEISNLFIDNIISGKQKTFWPYDNLRVTPVTLVKNKLNAKILGQIGSSNIYFSDRNSFLALMSSYIHALFDQVGSNEHTHVILNNAFEPFNPYPCLDMVQGSLCINVDRDPRDIYTSLIDSKKLFIPDYEKDKNIEKIKRQMTGFENIDSFIFRFKTMKENTVLKEDSRVLRIRYEDFVLHHEQMAKTVLEFTGINSSTKKNESLFNPELSKKNIGVWKDYENIPEIKKIENSLKKYCYQ